jgi:hypothetical protein
VCVRSCGAARVRLGTVRGGLHDVVFVAGALHAQIGHTRDVAALGRHLYVTVKANQPTLFTQVKRLPWAQVRVGDARRDIGHGRREPAPSRP